jgi:hypothetical protein
MRAGIFRRSGCLVSEQRKGRPSKARGDEGGGGGAGGEHGVASEDQRKCSGSPASCFPFGLVVTASFSKLLKCPPPLDLSRPREVGDWDGQMVV